MTTPTSDIVPLPLIADGPHGATGGYWVSCALPAELTLWLFGGPGPPRMDGRRPLFRVGQWLSGFVRRVGSASEDPQAEAERTGLFAGLPVEWFKVPATEEWWFRFRVEPELVGELVERLRAFASRAAAQKPAEPGATADGGA